MSALVLATGQHSLYCEADTVGIRGALACSLGRYGRNLWGVAVPVRPVRLVPYRLVRAVDTGETPGALACWRSPFDRNLREIV
jgi:hypothetical protein